MIYQIHVRHDWAVVAWDYSVRQEIKISKYITNSVFFRLVGVMWKIVVAVDGRFYPTDELKRNGRNEKNTTFGLNVVAATLVGADDGSKFRFL